MKRMKQWMHWVLALVLLVLSLSVPTAAAETITVNVTNTPVRGSVALEKTGLQLVRFTDEQDEWGNTVMKPVYQQGYLTALCLNSAPQRMLSARKGQFSTSRESWWKH